MQTILLKMFIDGNQIGVKEVYNMPRKGDIIQLAKSKFARIEEVIFSMDNSEDHRYDTLLIDLKAI